MSRIRRTHRSARRPRARPGRRSARSSSRTPARTPRPASPRACRSRASRGSAAGSWSCARRRRGSACAARDPHAATSRGSLVGRRPSRRSWPPARRVFPSASILRPLPPSARHCDGDTALRRHLQAGIARLLRLGRGALAAFESSSGSSWLPGTRRTDRLTPSERVQRLFPTPRERSKPSQADKLRRTSWAGTASTSAQLLRGIDVLLLVEQRPPEMRPGEGRFCRRIGYWRAFVRYVAAPA